MDYAIRFPFRGLTDFNGISTNLELFMTRDLEIAYIALIFLHLLYFLLSFLHGYMISSIPIKYK